MKILVINAGSSSIKYQLFDMPDSTVLAKGAIERIGQPDARLQHWHGDTEFDKTADISDHAQAMDLILNTLISKEHGVVADISEIAAVGHRVVHGAEEFTGSVEVSDSVIASLERYADLAPLHNPPNLVGIRTASEKLPTARQIACFDTAFHTSIPKIAWLYGLPYEMYEKHRIRRYGFHGTSHKYVSHRAAEMLGQNFDNVNLITCHLGNGCSITAVKNGKSIDTSMGFTPLEGVVMGTRCGDLDPAILFYLAEKDYSIQQLNDMCNKQGGLLGISGQSNDVRNLTELADSGNDRAKLAIDIFCYRIRKYIGAYTAVLGTVDAVVLTGGIGENASGIRMSICRDMPQLGIEIDPDKNSQKLSKAREINTDNSKIKIFVIPTDEEAAIASETYQIAKKGP